LNLKLVKFKKSFFYIKISFKLLKLKLRDFFLMTRNENLMGTTLIVVDYKDGVMIATDSQTSSGNLVTNRVADKITQISKFSVCCRSGSAADTQAITNQLRIEVKENSTRTEQNVKIRTIVQMLRNFCYKEKEKLNCGFICTGWDKFHGGQIYSIIQGGAVLRNKIALSGSGSLFINGFCEENYKEKMSRKECKTFLGRAVSLAILHDGGTGGVIRLCNISKSGIKRSVFFPNSQPKNHILLKDSFFVLV